MRKQLGITQNMAWVLAVISAIIIFSGFYLWMKSVAEVPQMDLKDIDLTGESDRKKKKKESRDGGTLGVDVERFADWSYKGTTGPESWGELSPAYLDCKDGRRQSPIDIHKVKTEDRLFPISFNYRTVKTALKHVGHTIEATMKKSGHIRVKNTKYNLQKVQFRIPSEHLIKGVPYDMEIQLIHQSEEGEKAVVSVLLEESDFKNDTIAELWKKIPRKNGHAAASQKLDPSKLIPRKRSYFHYEGSMTTPPCVEGVKWYVLIDSIKVSAKEVDIFNSIFLNNARPVQPNFNRPIVKGKG